MVAFSMLTIVLVASGWVTASVMKNVDKVGHLPAIKELAIAKALFNFYAIAVLCIVVVIRCLGFIETQLFVALLITIIGGLGFKVWKDLIHK